MHHKHYKNIYIHKILIWYFMYDGNVILLTQDFYVCINDTRLILYD